jgi:predicted DNA-binding transcriptional regulator AlpA
MSHVLAKPPSALLRPADLLALLSYKSQTTLWALVRSKELPEPIKIGPRAVAWHAHEIQALVAARAAGASTEAIQALVVDLTAARQAAWQRVRASVASAVELSA